MKDRDNDPGSEGAGATSSSLLAGVRQGDGEAWGRLARLYAPLVFGWCRRAGLRDADADDVLQEVFLTVAARIADFHHDSPGATFRGWLWTITRNKIGDLLRRRAKEVAAVGGTTAHERLLNAPDALPEEAPPAGGLYQRALDLVRGETTETTWLAFWHVVMERRSPADVARELGLSRNAVYIARSRVLQRLRLALGEEGSFHRLSGGETAGP